MSALVLERLDALATDFEQLSQKLQYVVPSPAPLVSKPVVATPKKASALLMRRLARSHPEAATAACPDDSGGPAHRLEGCASSANVQAATIQTVAVDIRVNKALIATIKVTTKEVVIDLANTEVAAAEPQPYASVAQRIVPYSRGDPNRSPRTCVARCEHGRSVDASIVSSVAGLRAAQDQVRAGEELEKSSGDEWIAEKCRAEDSQVALRQPESTPVDSAVNDAEDAEAPMLGCSAPSELAPAEPQCSSWLIPRSTTPAEPQSQETVTEASLELSQPLRPDGRGHGEASSSWDAARDVSGLGGRTPPTPASSTGLGVVERPRTAQGQLPSRGCSSASPFLAATPWHSSYEGSSGDELEGSSGDELEGSSGVELEGSSGDESERSSGGESERSFGEEPERSFGIQPERSSEDELEGNSGDELEGSSGDELEDRTTARRGPCASLTWLDGVAGSPDADSRGKGAASSNPWTRVATPMGGVAVPSPGRSPSSSASSELLPQRPVIFKYRRPANVPVLDLQGAFQVRNLLVQSDSTGADKGCCKAGGFKGHEKGADKGSYKGGGCKGDEKGVGFKGGGKAGGFKGKCPSQKGEGECKCQ